MADVTVEGPEETPPPVIPPAPDVRDRRHRSRRRNVIIGIAVVLLGTFALSQTSLNEGIWTQTMHVGFILSDPDGDIAGTVGDCSGTGGYDDFAPGMSVTVRNGEGAIIGSGNLKGLDDADEYFREQFADEDLSAHEQGTCVIAADIEVADSEFYEVSAGHRGELSYTREELEDGDWDVTLSLD